MKLPLTTRRATIRLARALSAQLQLGDLVVLDGPVGIGKTFFIRAACRALGVPATVPITSPTFGLVHDYQARLPIVHTDLYRLDDAMDVERLGLRERRWQCVTFAEWGQAFLASLGGDALTITFRYDGDARHAEFLATGVRSAERLASLACD